MKDNVVPVLMVLSEAPNVSKARICRHQARSHSASFRTCSSPEPCPLGRTTMRSRSLVGVSHHFAQVAWLVPVLGKVTALGPGGFPAWMSTEPPPAGTSRPAPSETRPSQLQLPAGLQQGCLRSECEVIVASWFVNKQYFRGSWRPNDSHCLYFIALPMFMWSHAGPAEGMKQLEVLPVACLSVPGLCFMCSKALRGQHDTRILRRTLATIHLDGSVKSSARLHLTFICIHHVAFKQVAVSAGFRELSR